MNFDWHMDEKELKKRVTEIFNEQALNELGSLDEADVSAIRETLLKYLGLLGETGYLGLGLGPGAASELLSLAAVQEEAALISGSLFLAVEASTRMFGGLIAGWAGPELKNELLEPLKSGKIIGGVAAAEAGGDQPREGAVTTGRLEGDSYVLTGAKPWVANGPIADRLAVYGEVEGKSAFFIVNTNQPGVALGERMHTLGYNGLAVSSLNLAGVKVPVQNVIGPFDNDDARIFISCIQDMILSAASLGVMKRTHDAAAVHARTHYRGQKPINSHQEVRFKLADTFTLYQTSQLLFYRAAWFLATGNKEADVLVACAKVFCSEAAEKTSSLALQILAGEGYVSGNPVEKGFRDAKYAALAGTTSEVSRMNIADDILRRYAI